MEGAAGSTSEVVDEARRIGMSESDLSADLAQAQAEMNRSDVRDLLLNEMRCPFGPRFFVAQLAAFVRDRCPDPAEHLPRVELWVGGERISVCHIMAVTPHWIAVAAHAEDERAKMRTELVPYATIGRVTIGRSEIGEHSVGFDVGRRPVVLDVEATSPEEELVLAATSPPATEGG